MKKIYLSLLLTGTLSAPFTYCSFDNLNLNNQAPTGVLTPDQVTHMLISNKHNPSFLEFFTQENQSAQRVSRPPLSPEDQLVRDTETMTLSSAHTTLPNQVPVQTASQSTQRNFLMHTRRRENENVVDRKNTLTKVINKQSYKDLNEVLENAIIKMSQQQKSSLEKQRNNNHFNAPSNSN